MFESVINDRWANECLTLYERVYAGDASAVEQQLTSEKPLHIAALVHVMTGDTLLHVAVNRGHIQCIQAIIQAAIKLFTPYKKPEIELKGDGRMARINNFDFAAAMRSGMNPAALISTLRKDEEKDRTFKDPNQLMLEKLAPSSSSSSSSTVDIPDPPYIKCHVTVDELVTRVNGFTGRMAIETAVQNHRSDLVHAILNECKDIIAVLADVKQPQHPGKSIYGTAWKVGYMGQDAAVHDHDDDDESCEGSQDYEDNKDHNEQSHDKNEEKQEFVFQYNDCCSIQLPDRVIGAYVPVRPRTLSELIVKSMHLSESLISDDSIDVIKDMIKFGMLDPFTQGLGRVDVDELKRQASAKYKYPKVATDFCFVYSNDSSPYTSASSVMEDPVQMAAAAGQLKLFNFLLSDECTHMIRSKAIEYNARALEYVWFSLSSHPLELPRSWRQNMKSFLMNQVKTLRHLRRDAQHRWLSS